MNNLIINFCPTGVMPTRKSKAPLQPDEIVKDVYDAYRMGVSIVHVHVRDKNDLNTSSPEIYKRVILKIRKRCPGIIICVSLSGRVCNTFESRSAVLDLEGDAKPDMASLTLSSMNFARTESINTPDMIINLLKRMNDRDIKPELEVFDVGMVNFSKYLIRKGLLKPPYYYNILCGNLFSAQADLNDISNIVSQLPKDSIYSFAGLGDYQAKMNALGVITADGVRVGLEDNIYYDKERAILATNEMLVNRVLSFAKIYDRSIATPDEVRKILNL